MRAYAHTIARPSDSASVAEPTLCPTSSRSWRRSANGSGWAAADTKGLSCWIGHSSDALSGLPSRRIRHTRRRARPWLGSLRPRMAIDPGIFKAYDVRGLYGEQIDED